MKSKINLLLLLVLFSSFIIKDVPCKKILIIPFTGKNGKVDRFKLAPIVKQRFQEIGFEVIDEESFTNNNGNCQILQCKIVHTENYWKNKEDTVSLIILDPLGKQVKQYQGITERIEMTFKSGYTNATVMALDQISSKDF